MAVFIKCDVCKILIGPKDKSFHLEDFFSSKALVEIKKLISIESEKTDVCHICIDKLVGNLMTTVRDLAQIPPTIKHTDTKTEISQKPARDRSFDLRLWLCRLVEEGTSTRNQICLKLYGRFPNYKSPQSISPRVSDLISPTKAHTITKGTGFEGKIAMIETKHGRVVWVQKKD